MWLAWGRAITVTDVLLGLALYVVTGLGVTVGFHRLFTHRSFTDLWPLALPSFGESWHNGHHSDPSCARHGRGPGQIDLSAELIRLFERLGWATDVHRPDRDRRHKAPPSPS